MTPSFFVAGKRMPPETTTESLTAAIASAVKG
jgi:hypothetical protein